MNPAFDQPAARATGALPDFPHSEHPHYMTPRGLAQLRARRAEVAAHLGSLESGGASEGAPVGEDGRDLLERELRWLDHRLAGAIEVDPLQQPRERVAFGATVTVDSGEGEQRWQIVGEDETDVEQGRVSYLSPLAQALLGSRIDEEVTWQRPAGNLPIEIVAIDYGSH